jgi:hypothetical protein
VEDARISRRTFLKIFGAGAAVLAFGLMGGDFLAKNRFSQTASAQSSGSWSRGPDTTTIAIHAALLHSGKIFYLAGSGFHRVHGITGPYEARILDINNGTEKRLTQSEDLFCVGLADLPNGNILLAGGTLRYDTDPANCSGRWHGLDAAYEVDVASQDVIKVPSMAHGRWYPTCITLPNGSVFVVNGYDEYGSPNYLVEIYDPASKSWTKSFDPNRSTRYCVGHGSEGTCAGAGSPCYGGPGNGAAPGVSIYARGHLMPNGSVVICGPLTNVWSWNPSTGRWLNMTNTSTYRHYGCSFLLPLSNTTSERGKVLLVGGSPSASSPATNTAEIIDFDAGSSSSPIVRGVASLQYARKFLLPVMLPDGKLVVFGGSSNLNSNPVYVPEMFDPVTERWSSLATASVPRVYHGVALLLPDGRVWTAGSTPTSDRWELRTEIFSPAYCFAERPTISGDPVVGRYGETISIPTPQAVNIKSVSLLKLQANTHHYDANVRLVWLQILARSSNSLTVAAPINANIAPPGFYMIHVLNDSGIPSIAKIVKIPGLTAGGGEETFYNVPHPGNSSASLLSGVNTRYGEEARLSSSVIVDKPLKKLTVYLRKAGSPSGTVRAVVRRSSDDAVVAAFSEMINSAALLTTFAEIVFTLPVSYVIQPGDKILIEYDGPGRVDIQIWNEDKIDGNVTRRTRYDGSGYVGGNTQDIVGTMSTG